MMRPEEGSSHITQRRTGTMSTNTTASTLSYTLDPKTQIFSVAGRSTVRLPQACANILNLMINNVGTALSTLEVRTVSGLGSGPSAIADAMNNLRACLSRVGADSWIVSGQGVRGYTFNPGPLEPLSPDLAPLTEDGEIDWKCNDGEATRTLIRLLSEGFSNTEIARLMGISMGTVTGKASRLQQKDDTPRAIIPKRARGQRSASTFTPAEAKPPSRQTPSQPTTVVATAPAQPATNAVVAQRTWGTSKECCWPLGDVRTPGFRFCNADTIPGKPYCAEHAAVAYVKVRDSREEAAA